MAVTLSILLLGVGADPYSVQFFLNEDDPGPLHVNPTDLPQGSAPVRFQTGFRG